jgi:hypothetical protein
MGNLMLRSVSKKKVEVLGNVPTDFFGLSAKDIDGNLIKFSSYQLTNNNPNGKKAFLIVNVACD